MKTRLLAPALNLLLWLAERLRWPALAFKVMDWQRASGLPYERSGR